MIRDWWASYARNVMTSQRGQVSPRQIELELARQETIFWYGAKVVFEELCNAGGDVARVAEIEREINGARR